MRHKGIDRMVLLTCYSGCTAFLFCMLLAVGCSSGGGNGDSEDNQDSDDAPDLEQACFDSCEAQYATDCYGVHPIGRCIELCILVAEEYTGCEQAWIDLNACMATSPLSCDRVKGGVSVSSEDCGPEIDAFTECN